VTDTVVFAGESQAVVCQDGLITMIGSLAAMSLPAGALTVDTSGLLLAPGLIDIQLNGGFGHDITQEPASVWDVGSQLPKWGVTSFLPTVITSGADRRESMLATLAAGPPSGYVGATPLGVHFEGPFINAERAGAHDLSLLRQPAHADPDVEQWSATSGVRMVTLAPELPGALELTRSLVARGVVVSAGHSAATRDQALAGFDAGISYATHLFNAMPALGHREPGLVGAALIDPRVTVGLIPDGIHVHPDVVRMTAAAVGPGRISVVTDATAGLGMTAGRYVLGGRDVVLDETSVRLANDGRLAGSALTADRALRGFKNAVRWPAEQVIATMTAVPAHLLSLSDRGRIEVGMRADLTVMTEHLEVVATYIGGKQWR